MARWMRTLLPTIHVVLLMALAAGVIGVELTVEPLILHRYVLAAVSFATAVSPRSKSSLHAARTTSTDGAWGVVSAALTNSARGVVLGLGILL